MITSTIAIIIGGKSTEKYPDKEGVYPYPPSKKPILEINPIRPINMSSCFNLFFTFKTRINLILRYLKKYYFF